MAADICLSSGRQWIETGGRLRHLGLRTNICLSSGRQWIETFCCLIGWGLLGISASLRGGSGLKLINHWRRRLMLYICLSSGRQWIETCAALSQAWHKDISASLRGGSGLKPMSLKPVDKATRISASLRGGSGLKRFHQRRPQRFRLYLPLFGEAVD